MLQKIEQKLILYISIFLTIFTVLPILAPIFAYLGFDGIADVIYTIYSATCHQRPWRSYHIFDLQFAMDARMMLMFASMAIGGFVVYFKKLKPLSARNLLIFSLLTILPLAADGTIQAIAEIYNYYSGELPFYESANFTRSMTGAIFGTGIAFALFPIIYSNSQERTDIKTMSRYAMGVFGMSFVLIPIFTFFWYITSNTYLPSSPLIDFEQRFPGYNYEITTSAGHSTIVRDIGDIQIYINRAEKYGKTDLIEQYRQNNPESIHIHAGFVLVKDGAVLPLDNIRYMDIKPCDKDADHTSITKEEQQKEKAHLHDGVGDVVHVHWDNGTWGDLFKNIKIEMSKDTYALSDGQRIDNILDQKIEAYQNLVIISGDTGDLNLSEVEQKVPTRERIEEVEQKSELCGTE